MKRITLTLAAITALAFVGFDSQRAEAAHGFRGFGVHLGGPNFHVDVGNPHGYGWGRTHVVRRRSPVHYDWHNTSHYDYIPAHAVPHGNHIDYVPGRVQYHREGHWDRHRGFH